MRRAFAGLVVLVLAVAPGMGQPLPTASGPQVAPAAPGVFTAQKQGAVWRLTVTARTLADRGAVESYLAYRAAELARENRAQWFLLVESRAKGDPVPPPPIPAMGMRYSFRMENWRPVWRYRTAAAPDWKIWTPFSGRPFLDGADPRSVTEYQVQADIRLHPGEMVANDPLAFEAASLSDYLVNQVQPPA
jgi:hypothetical protein